MSNNYERNIERATSLLLDTRHALDENEGELTVSSKDIDTITFLVQEAKKADMYRNALDAIHTGKLNYSSSVTALEVLGDAESRFAPVTHLQKRPHFTSTEAKYEEYNGLPFEILEDSEGPQNSYKIRLGNGEVITAWSHEIFQRDVIDDKPEQEQPEGENDMVKKRTWKEFRENGLLWMINTTLHMFGWSIVVEADGDGNIRHAYPARVRFRGFSEKSNTDGYIKVTEHLKENIDELVKESKE
ncbi:hypothetical protein C0431_12660 [bacterium]|nr:hypothetical protein [bacterium]